MKITTILGVFSIVLLSACSGDKSAVKSYLNTTSAVIKDDWKVVKVKAYDDFYYVTLTIGKDEQTFDLFNNLMRYTGKNTYDDQVLIESKYAGFVQRLCPNVNTVNGKKFWDSVSMKYLILNPIMKNTTDDFASVKCTRTASKPNSGNLSSF